MKKTIATPAGQPSNHIELTQLEVEELNQREIDHVKYLEEEAKTEYKRERAKAYPSIADQLDMIYHGSLESWRAEIKKVKDAHPKPSGE